MKILQTFLFCLGLIALGHIERAAAEGPVSVGVILPLSGGLADYGTAFQNGMKLALSDDPSIDQKVKFIFEDSQYDNRHALTAFDKLSGSDRCKLVLVWGSGPSESVAPVAERKGFPLMTLGEHAAAVGRPHVVTFTNPSVQFSAPLAAYLHGSGYKNIAIVMTQITYFETLFQTLKETLPEGVRVSIIDTYLPSDNDFKATVAKLRGSRPDALGIYLLNGQVSRFYKQMEEQQIKLPTFGTDIFESTKEIHDSEPAIEGAVYSHNLTNEEFQKKYVATFRTDVQIPSAARGYDFVNLVARYIEPAKAEPGETLLQAFGTIPTQHGVCGEYRFVDSPTFGKHFEFPIAVKEIRDGKIRIKKM